MEDKEKKRKREDLIMLVLAGAVLGGVAYVLSQSMKNPDKIGLLESELRECEASENYERCAEIKKILDNIKY